MNIQKSTSTNCTTAYKNRKIQFIVIHYTAGVSSKAGAAKNTSNWFKNPNCKGSADYIVDDANIVQYNPDPANRYCWSVGGSKYSKMATSLGGKYHNICKNNNSVSIEICSNKRNTKTLLATDTDWFFTESAVKNAADLCKYLMGQHGIAADHVIMHHQVTGKICPNPWTVNENALSGWNAFKKQLSAVQQAFSAYRVKVTADSLNIRKGAGVNFAVVGQINDKGIYTIVEEKSGWGKLKSGAGWINLAYTKKV